MDFLSKHGNELLLECLRSLNNGAHETDLSRFSHQDWQLIYESGSRQTLAPYLYSRLTEQGWIDQVPGDVVEKLRRSTLLSARSRIRLEEELRLLLTHLNREHVKVIVLKGAHLSELVYREPQLRPMDDIDLLVRAVDLLQCDQVLVDLGYGPSSRKWVTSELIASHQHLPVFLKPHVNPIEIHWNISHPDTPATIALDQLWERAQPASIAGVDTLVLSAEDLLLHICIHACYDNLYSGGLRPLIDVSETLQHYQDELDWEKITTIAHNWNAHKPLYLTLTMTHEMLGTPIPFEVLDKLEPEEPDPQVIESAREMIISEDNVSKNFARLWGTGNLGHKASSLLRRVFLPPGDMVRKYSVEPGSTRFYLAYAKRVKELAARYSGDTWRILRGSGTQTEVKDHENILMEWIESS